MATYLGGGRAGGSQVRDRTERVGRSCARERFKRPRVSKQTDSLADSAGQCAAEPGDQRRPFTSRMDAMHRRAPPTAPTSRRQHARHDCLFRARGSPQRRSSTSMR
jgi:hypothetical protein